ncbi:unnamed protein product [Prorocentrum cordatum]|uniref:Uncharacterized protein n=1 Tax=Prorocentrum cordatum TaxID=2364126 RepID=A0ABN9TA65_9DINO|nr:unnamed protein product [Polarella glacialis]
MLPKKLRAYFSRPESEDELKEVLAEKGELLLLRRLEQEDKASPAPSPLSTDAGPAPCPERHVRGGHMRDRDGQVKAWNDRWHASASNLNAGAHPAHRQYFSRDSPFQSAPSQKWRRFMDLKVNDGDDPDARWQSDGSSRPPRFGPMGG